MTSITINTEVDVNLDDVFEQCSDSEIQTALAKRFSGISDLPHVAQIYEAFRMGNRERVDELLRQLFWGALGRVA